jgi:hypothetical protein
LVIDRQIERQLDVVEVVAVVENELRDDVVGSGVSGWPSGKPAALMPIPVKFTLMKHT